MQTVTILYVLLHCYNETQNNDLIIQSYFVRLAAFRHIIYY